MPGWSSTAVAARGHKYVSDIENLMHRMAASAAGSDSITQAAWDKLVKKQVCVLTLCLDSLRLLLSYTPKAQQSSSAAVCTKQLHRSGLLQLLPQLLATPFRPPAAAATAAGILC
jgi:hypothetical protein